MTMSRQATETLETSPAAVTSLEDHNDDTPTFEAGISILDAIISAGDLGQPVKGTWNFARKGVNLPIRSISQDEYELVNKQYTVRMRIGRGQQVHTELDADGLNMAIVALGTLDPDFNDNNVRVKLARSAKSQGGVTIAEAIKLVFLPGEITNISNTILQLSGFRDEESTINSLKGSSSGE